MCHLSLLQVIFSKYTDLLPKEVLNDDTAELQKPDEEAVKEVRHVVLCMYEKTSRWSSDQVTHCSIDFTT